MIYDRATGVDNIIYNDDDRRDIKLYVLNYTNKEILRKKSLIDESRKRYFLNVPPKFNL